MQIKKNVIVVFIHNLSVERVMRIGGIKKQPKGLFEE